MFSEANENKREEHQERATGTDAGNFAAATASATKLRRVARIDSADPVLITRSQRTADKVLAAAELAGAPIAYLGVGTVPAVPRLFPGPTTDWILMHADHDPLFHDPRRFPIPKAERRHLERLANAGVEMDFLLVAHEVPNTTVNGALPALRRNGAAPVDLDPETLTSIITHPGPTPATKKFTEKSGRIADRTLAAARKTARIAGRAAVGIGAAAAALAVAPVIGGAMFVDPIVFGARTIPGAPSDVVGIYELVRWDWEA